MRKTLTAIVAAAWAAATGHADTIHLADGTSLNGSVSKNSDGSFVLTVDGNSLVYRASEVASHEKNDLTGLEYRERAKEIAEQAELESQESTGLTSEQQAKVDSLIEEFKSSDKTALRDTIAGLIAYGRKVDIVKYLEFTIPSLTPQKYAPALEVFCTLASKEAAYRSLTAAAIHPAVDVRAQALRLMGSVGNPQGVDYLGRGLVDPAIEVRLAATAALGVLNAKRATPALIASLQNNPQMVQGAVYRTLNQIWQDTGQLPADSDVSAWEKFWSGHKSGVGSPVDYSALEPLVDPKQQFVEG